MQTIAAKKVFTGEEWLTDVSIIVEEGKISAIKNFETPDPGALFIEDGFLAPAFIDVQVYGAASRLFAVYPDVITLQTMREVFEKSGTILFQPTLATNTPDVFTRGVDAVKAYWQSGGQGVWGLHIEGPWINSKKRGAHIESLIHVPSEDDVRALLEYGKGVIRMITLAPEVCSPEIIQLIRSYDVVVSAGHSSAGYQQSMQAFNDGVTAVTHLYNAMSGLHHREPGLVGATLHHDSVFASIIPDGYHVDFAAISIAKKLMGERLFAITDAVTETSEGPYRHHYTGNKYECNGTLSGSSLTMHQAFLNLVQQAGISIDEALRMCSTYPAKLLGCGQQYGTIQPGASAQVMHLNDSMDKVKLINGEAA